MSKSDPPDSPRIHLTEDAETNALKFRTAKTDPDPLPSDLEGLKARPEADNLVGIYAALADMTREQVLAEHGRAQFSQFKPILAELAVEKLAPIAGEMRRLLADPAHVDAILADGARRAAAIARPIIAQVKQIIGFVVPQA
jgi:tryptophanyl-tRNA synthetase